MKKAAAKKKISKVMKEYKAGTLNIGKSKKMVKSKKQAVAIALSQAARSYVISLNGRLTIIGLGRLHPHFEGLPQTTGKE
jgi:hypothetical protein